MLDKKIIILQNIIVCLKSITLDHKLELLLTH